MAATVRSFAAKNSQRDLSFGIGPVRGSTATMPEAPEIGLFTKYVLENPYPLGGVLLVGGLVAGYLGMREGRRRRLQIAGGLLLVGFAVIGIGLSVVTSAEHGERVTRRFVAAVVDADLDAAKVELSDNVILNAGSTTNPGFELAVLMDRLEYLLRTWPIDSNHISNLDGYSENDGRAMVHMTCWTEGESYGLTPSQWVVIVERDDKGDWRITRLTCVSINGRTPSLPRLFP